MSSDFSFYSTKIWSMCTSSYRLFRGIQELSGACATLLSRECLSKLGE